MSERPESQFPADFSRVVTPILDLGRLGAVTLTELRRNLRKAGMELDDDEALDPRVIELPPLDEGDDDDDYEDATEEAA